MTDVYEENKLFLKISFTGSNLEKGEYEFCKAVDLTEGDLTESIFDNCDLMNAHFERTILRMADLRTAHNFSIDPETNNIKKAKFALSQLHGLLNKYQIDIDELI